VENLLRQQINLKNSILLHGTMIFSDGFFEKQITEKIMCFVLALFNSYFNIKCAKRVFFVHEKVF
jgi:hypothetical protein